MDFTVIFILSCLVDGIPRVYRSASPLDEYNEAIEISQQTRCLQDASVYGQYDCSKFSAKEREHALALLEVRKRKLMSHLEQQGVVWEQAPRAVQNEQGFWIDNRLISTRVDNGYTVKRFTAWNSREGDKNKWILYTHSQWISKSK